MNYKEIILQAYPTKEIAFAQIGKGVLAIFIVSVLFGFIAQFIIERQLQKLDLPTLFDKYKELNRNKSN
jgi:hypothetical protein